MKRFMIVSVLMLFSLAATLYGQGFMRIDGFDFAATSASTFAVPIDDKVTAELARYYQNPVSVVAGHSQGGLTGLGLVKKELADAKAQNRASYVKAFISVDSPVRGFAGLDYGYDVMRSRLVSTIDLHTRAVGSALSVIPIIDLIGVFYPLSIDQQHNIVLIMSKLTPVEPLVNTLMNKPSSEAGAIRQITDMGRLSGYVAANVGPTTITKVRYQSGSRSYLALEWRSGWLGIPYPVIVTITEPIYSYYDRYDYTPNFRNDIKIGHIVGTDSDPLRLTGEDGLEGTVRGAKDAICTGYNVAGGIHTALAVLTFPIGTAHYANHASNCFSGADWVNNYQTKWGELIGGQASDGFITEASQVLPGTPVDFIQPIKIDHNRSTTDDGIWNPDKGEVTIMIKEKMRLKE